MALPLPPCWVHYFIRSADRTDIVQFSILKAGVLGGRGGEQGGVASCRFRAQWDWKAWVDLWMCGSDPRENKEGMKAPGGEAKEGQGAIPIFPWGNIIMPSRAVL